MNYGLIRTAIGEVTAPVTVTAAITVIAASSGRGLCLIGLAVPESRFREEHPDAVRDDEALGDALRLLRRYFAGQRVQLGGLKLDLSAGSPFQQAVWRELRRIPWGEVISYSELARRAGRPRAARAVGNAVGRNPLPVVVPCHRVIKADGSIGGFGCGVEIKRALLGIEGITAAQAGAGDGGVDVCS